MVRHRCILTSWSWIYWRVKEGRHRGRAFAYYIELWHEFEQRTKYITETTKKSVKERNGNLQIRP